MPKRLIALAVPLAFGAVLTACSAGAGTHSAATAPGRESGASPDANIAAIVQCYRAHGDPSFPDPVYDPGDGRWHFGTSPASAPVSTQQACQHLFPASTPSPPVPQAQFQKLVRLAQCIRQHGIPSFADPVLTPGGAVYSDSRSIQDASQATSSAVTAACGALVVAAALAVGVLFRRRGRLRPSWSAARSP